MIKKLKCSKSRACRLAGLDRSVLRYQSKMKDRDSEIRAKIIALATKFGRYGYRRITALLRKEGLVVNHKKVRRIWREEGLKVPSKQPKRGRLWLTDGSCIRHRPLYKHHVWSYDFVTDRTEDGRTLKMLNIIDEFSRECLSIHVKRRMNSKDVLEELARLFMIHGTPDFIRSDNGPEFIAERLRTWLGEVGVKTLFIEPGSPWENGYVESFNARFRDELMNGEIFYTLKEAVVVTEAWRREYNELRPHSSLGYKPPAPASVLPDYEVKKRVG